MLGYSANTEGSGRAATQVPHREGKVAPTTASTIANRCWLLGGSVALGWEGSLSSVSSCCGSLRVPQPLPASFPHLNSEKAAQGGPSVGHFQL